jgi:GT2 family glycosyltransferase
MNGNCVLINKAAASRVGNIDERFTHSMGDLDYGLRARSHGCAILVAPTYVGVCDRNSIRGTWKDKTLSSRMRLRALVGPKGLPLLEWATFVRSHGGPLWPLVWLYPYCKFAVRCVTRADY